MEADFLKQRGLRVKVVGRNVQDLMPELCRYPVEIVEENPQLIISHGGDGSLLGAEREFPGVPKCAIRDTAMNPKCASHSYRQVLDALFAGELKHGTLDILEVSPNSEPNRILRGMNDIVITRQVITSAIRYRIWADGVILRRQIIADSLIVATPFGSTGYFQSITGGHFETGIGLAISNPIDGPKFAVIPMPRKLEIELLRGPAMVGADNNPEFFNLETGDRLTIVMSPRKTDIFGVDVFRCQECFLLRRNGIDRRL